VFGEHHRDAKNVGAGKMRKRLRKKRRLGEFRESLFGVRYSLRAGLAAEAADDFLGQFLERAIEANGLSCGGGGQGQTWELYVSLARRGSPTETQRAAVGDWLREQLEVRAYALGDFFDGWHGAEEAPYASPAIGIGA
jgi:uncharacterized protein YggL (DUF469 family)